VSHNIHYVNYDLSKSVEREGLTKKARNGTRHTPFFCILSQNRPKNRLFSPFTPRKHPKNSLFYPIRQKGVSVCIMAFLPGQADLQAVGMAAAVGLASDYRRLT
jgi:hypothetical protein